MNEPEAKRRATPRLRWAVLLTIAVWASAVAGPWLLTRDDYYRTFPSAWWFWAMAAAAAWTTALVVTRSEYDADVREAQLRDLRLSRGVQRTIRAAAGVLESVDARRHTVLGAYGAFLTDITQIAEMPLLADRTCPATEAFTTQLVTAEDARTDAVHDPTRLRAYADAVATLERAWTAALTYARRKGVGPLDPEDRQAVLRARKLLDVALNDRAYPAERREAMHRAVALLRTVVDVPIGASSALEHRVARLEIER